MWGGSGGEWRAGAPGRVDSVKRGVRGGDAVDNSIAVRRARFKPHDGLAAAPNPPRNGMRPLSHAARRHAAAARCSLPLLAVVLVY